MLAAPLRERVKPKPRRKYERLVAPYKRAKASISATGSPVMRAAHSGVRVCRCASSSRQSSANLSR